MPPAREQSGLPALERGGHDCAAASHPNYVCDRCGGWFTGPPGSSGLFIWTRGGEVRYEEPPLCDGCASALNLNVLVQWREEE